MSGECEVIQLSGSRSKRGADNAGRGHRNRDQKCGHMGTTGEASYRLHSLVPFKFWCHKTETDKLKAEENAGHVACVG